MHGPMNEGESATNVKMLWIISSGRSEIIISYLIDYRRTAVVADFLLRSTLLLLFFLLIHAADVVWRQNFEKAGKRGGREKEALPTGLGEPLILTPLKNTLC